MKIEREEVNVSVLQKPAITVRLEPCAKPFAPPEGAVVELPPYGTIYLGGIGDSNFIALSFLNDIPTDRDTPDIRVSALNYPTDQVWPRLDVLRNQGFI
ncbi:TPA: hypothetical protein ACFRHF_001776 [Neisseria lactamica]